MSTFKLTQLLHFILDEREGFYYRRHYHRIITNIIIIINSSNNIITIISTIVPSQCHLYLFIIYYH